MSRDLTTIAAVANEKRKLLDTVRLELFNRRNEVARLEADEAKLVADVDELKAEAAAALDGIRDIRMKADAAESTLAGLTKAQEDRLNAAFERGQPSDQTGVFTAGTANGSF